MSHRLLRWGFAVLGLASLGFALAGTLGEMPAFPISGFVLGAFGWFLAASAPRRKSVAWNRLVVGAALVLLGDLPFLGTFFPLDAGATSLTYFGAMMAYMLGVTGLGAGAYASAQPSAIGVLRVGAGLIVLAGAIWMPMDALHDGLRWELGNVLAFSGAATVWFGLRRGSDFP